jgi:hypothetical protein
MGSGNYLNVDLKCILVHDIKSNKNRDIKRHDLCFHDKKRHTKRDSD